MILLADSGSTKTDWVLLRNNETVVSFKTAGMNPYYLKATEGVRMLHDACCNHIEPDLVSRVHFYGAGCLKPTKAALIREIIQEVLPGRQVEVSSDLLAAGRALFGYKKGIVCILGTGASVCTFDGEKIEEYIPSLGYLFGDEGSGAHLGKSFLYRLLRGQLPQPVMVSFQKEIGLSDEEILTHLYNHKNPNRFLASFAPFIATHLHQHEIHNLVVSCFDEFFSNQLMKITNYNQAEIGLVGSVAYHFREILEDVAAKSGLKISNFMLSPMQGLISYHCQPNP